MLVWLDIREANLSIRDQNARSENRKEICPRSENKQDIRICYNMKSNVIRKELWVKEAKL